MNFLINLLCFQKQNKTKIRKHNYLFVYFASLVNDYHVWMFAKDHPKEPFSFRDYKRARIKGRRFVTDDSAATHPYL